jgi:FAD/FMN-containing dehydrogenase
MQFDQGAVDRDRSSHPDVLERDFRGGILRPGSVEYDEARRVWNGEIERFPAVVLQPLDQRDVAVGLDYARRQGLPVSVRGGGHHVAGTALCDGVVLDLAHLQAVTVDPDARCARVEGGATWAMVDAATQAHGLVVPGGVMSETGVGGLTLGGGMGWLRRAFGLSSDQVVAMEVVTADGVARRVDADHHPDLFRALRGGGGGLAVVTAFEFALHALGPEVMFALTMYPAMHGGDVLRVYRTVAAGVPDEVTTSVLLGTVPPILPFPESSWGQRFVAVAGMYAGDPDRGEEVLAPLGTLGGVDPIIDLTGRQRYAEVQRLYDANYPDGGHYYWTSRFLDGLPDEVLDAALAQAEAAPSHLSVVAFWQLGGMIDRADADASAYAHRGAAYLLGVEANFASSDPDPEERLANVEWARRSVAEIAQSSHAGSYVNLPGSVDDLREAYDSETAVEQVRRRYDPDGLFAVLGDSRRSGPVQDQAR